MESALISFVLKGGEDPRKLLSALEATVRLAIKVRGLHEGRSSVEEPRAADCGGCGGMEHWVWTQPVAPRRLDENALSRSPRTSHDTMHSCRERR